MGFPWGSQLPRMEETDPTAMPSPAQTTPAQIQALFDRIAPAYDDLNQWLSLGLHQVWKGMTVRWAQPPVGGRVLDLCCGSGDLALQLGRRVGPWGQVIGVDFSAALLAIAQRRAQQRLPRHRFEWLQGDVLDLPLPADYVDAITVGYGLRNVVDIPQALREIYRVLKPGAWGAILDFHQPTDPCMQRFQQLYLGTIVVPVATALGLQQEYAYIQPSLDQFLSQDQQRDLAHALGFTSIRFYELAGGLMGVLVIQKPDSLL